MKRADAIGAGRVALHVLQCAMVLVAVMAVPSAAAGQPAEGSSGQSAEGSSEQRETPKEQPPPPTSDDRLFWTLPNFLTVENADHSRPLTRREKYDVVFRTTFDYVEFAWYGVLSAINQAENDEPTEGRGLSGYAKRFGTAFADGSIDNFMVGAVFPAMLKQDPRYFQLGEGSAWHRMSYAVSRLAVTRGDSGHSQVNLSELLGTAATAGLANAYRPSVDRNMKTVASVWLSQIAYDGLSLTLKEFWPDIRRKISHH